MAEGVLSLEMPRYFLKYPCSSEKLLTQFQLFENITASHPLVRPQTKLVEVVGIEPTSETPSKLRELRASPGSRP